MAEYSMSARMREALAVIADAKSGEISGWSVATWLGMRRHPEGIRESLRALTNRGLVTMRRMEDRQFPDRLKAIYSIAKFAPPESNPEPTEKR